MNLALQVFQVREAFSVDYKVPAVDVIVDGGSLMSFVPEAPKMISVAYGVAKFSSVAGATTYILFKRTGGTLYVNLDVAFSDGGAGEELTINNADIVGPAFYRVVAYNDIGPSPASAPMFLEVVALPETPVATAATGATTTAFTANWNAATGATGYRLDVSTDFAFGSFVSGFNDLAVGNVLTYPVTGLTIGTAYYYRLRATNVVGHGSTSNIISIGTITAPGTVVYVNNTSHSLGSALGRILRDGVLYWTPWGAGVAANSTQTVSDASLIGHTITIEQSLGPTIVSQPTAGLADGGVFFETP